jgi:hypothetical protein
MGLTVTREAVGLAVEDRENTRQIGYVDWCWQLHIPYRLSLRKSGQRNCLV